MNNNKRLDSGQSLLSAPSQIVQPPLVEEISPMANSHGQPNITQAEEEKEQLEARALKQEIIELSRQFFATLGEKLKYYRDRKLYRFEASTFGQWCEQELGMKRFYVYRLISAYEVYQNVAHGQQKVPENLLPTNERQVRPLTKLPSEQQIEIWLKALQESDKMPTGKQIEQLVREKKRMESEVRHQTHVDRFLVGDLVRITAKYNNELKGYHSCWAQIVSLEEYSYTALTWKGAVSELAHDDLMLLRVASKDAAGTLLSQLIEPPVTKVRDSHIDS